MLRKLKCESQKLLANPKDICQSNKPADNLLSSNAILNEVQLSSISMHHLRTDISHKLNQLSSIILTCNDEEILRTVASHLNTALNYTKLNTIQSPMCKSNQVPHNKKIEPQRSFYSTRKHPYRPTTRIAKPTTQQQTDIRNKLLTGQNVLINSQMEESLG